MGDEGGFLGMVMVRPEVNAPEGSPFVKKSDRTCCRIGARRWANVR